MNVTVHSLSAVGGLAPVLKSNLDTDKRMHGLSISILIIKYLMCVVCTPVVLYGTWMDRVLSSMLSSSLPVVALHI